MPSVATATREVLGSLDETILSDLRYGASPSLPEEQRLAMGNGPAAMPSIECFRHQTVELLALIRDWSDSTPLQGMLGF
jgi:hypothetical protein